jgi:hypothetical protein
MQDQDSLAQKKSKKWQYILGGAIVILVVFLFVQDKKIEKQQALKIQFIEEKNALRDDLDDLIDDHE